MVSIINQGIPKASTQKIYENNHAHNHKGRQIKATNPGSDVKRNAGDGQKLTEDNRRQYKFWNVNY